MNRLSWLLVVFATATLPAQERPAQPANGQSEIIAEQVAHSADCPNREDDDDALPDEPVQIGTTPQLVFDNFIVDNHWAIKYKRESVRRVFHQPKKFEGNPIIRGEGGYTTVIRDEANGLFRMWYQTWVASPIEGKTGRYAIAYAESKDGLAWTLPKLGLFQWKGTKENNIVWTGLRGKRGSQVYMLDLPENERRGFRFVMLYGGSGGSHLIGSRDGVHWDRESDTTVTKMHSDTQNAIVYDPRRREYVMFCRAKHIYRTFRGDIIDTGASRRVACMAKLGAKISLDAGNLKRMEKYWQSDA